MLCRLCDLKMWCWASFDVCIGHLYFFCEVFLQIIFKFLFFIIIRQSYIFWIQALCLVYVWWIFFFSQSVTCIFIFLMFFAEQKVFILMKSSWWAISIICCAFGGISKNSLANLGLWRFSPTLFSLSFIVLRFTFRAIMHSEAFFFFLMCSVFCISCEA